MAFCTRCQSSDWHPSVRNCTLPDCGLTASRVEQRQLAANDGSVVRHGPRRNASPALPSRGKAGLVTAGAAA